MSKSTLRFSIILVITLFLNIEAAQAGLLTRIKIYVLREFPDQQFPWLISGVVLGSIFLYGLLAPVKIGKEKRVWLNYDPFPARKHRFDQKKASVSRISEVLQAAPPSNTVHS